MAHRELCLSIKSGDKQYRISIRNVDVSTNTIDVNLDLPAEQRAEPPPFGSFLNIVQNAIINGIQRGNPETQPNAQPESAQPVTAEDYRRQIDEAVIMNRVRSGRSHSATIVQGSPIETDTAFTVVSSPAFINRNSAPERTHEILNNVLNSDVEHSDEDVSLTKDDIELATELAESIASAADAADNDDANDDANDHDAANNDPTLGDVEENSVPSSPKEDYEDDDVEDIDEYSHELQKCMLKSMVDPVLHEEQYTKRFWDSTGHLSTEYTQLMQFGEVSRPAASFSSLIHKHPKAEYLASQNDTLNMYKDIFINFDEWIRRTMILEQNNPETLEVLRTADTCFGLYLLKFPKMMANAQFVKLIELFDKPENSHTQQYNQNASTLKNIIIAINNGILFDIIKFLDPGNCECSTCFA